MTLEEIKQEMHEAWIKIDETSWNERSQHPSPLVVCDFLDSFADRIHAAGEAAGKNKAIDFLEKHVTVVDGKELYEAARNTP